jgi:hypothetical protein
MKDITYLLKQDPDYLNRGEAPCIKQKALRAKIEKLTIKYHDLTSKASDIFKKKEELIKQLQNKCNHEKCLERTPSYRDEYDEWHNDSPERKCVDCSLKERSHYTTKGLRYNILHQSKVVHITQQEGDKLFSLEFEDINL